MSREDYVRNDPISNANSLSTLLPAQIRMSLQYELDCWALSGLPLIMWPWVVGARAPLFWLNRKFGSALAA